MQSADAQLGAAGAVAFVWLLERSAPCPPGALLDGRLPRADGRCCAAVIKPSWLSDADNSFSFITQRRVQAKVGATGSTPPACSVQHLPATHPCSPGPRAAPLCSCSAGAAEAGMARAWACCSLHPGLHLQRERKVCCRQAHCMPDPARGSAPSAAAARWR